jgi:hypothetical protein
MQELLKLNPNGQWSLETLEKADKPSKADIWKQTVAFLAPHNKGYAAIHEKNLAADKKPEAAKPKSGPTKSGTRGEMAQTKGAIKSQRVSYPLKDHTGKETGEKGHRNIQVQETHHWKHNGEKWEHSHTTTSGEGLNKK